MSLTVDQAWRQALARAYEATNEIPMTVALGYRRLGVRQQVLLAQAGKENPEFYGTEASTDLAFGAADFARVINTALPPPAFVDQVVIADPGTSAYPVGQIVSIVPVSDPTSGVRPRATLRDLVLRAIGTDLDGVASVLMYYTRQAPMYDHNSGDTVLELASPHDELLVIDLAKILLGRSPAASSQAVVALLAALAAEEGEGLTAFRAYVREYAPLEARFGVGL